MLKSLCASILVCTSMMVAFGDVPQATVAPFAKPPTIDGKLEAGEWDGALRLDGAININNFMRVPHLHATYFGFTTEHLYFAIVTELPPDGKLLAEQKYRDSTEMIWDDGIELYIDPNRGWRAAGEGDLSYFHYHGNSAGAFLDILYSVEGAPDAGWNANWKVANGIDTNEKVWIQEISVPVTDLGMKPGDVIGRETGILIARNIKRGWGWIQGTAFPFAGAFVDVEKYPVIKLTKDSPTVSIDSVGSLDIHKGPMKLDARIFNPGPARQVKVDLYIESTTMPELQDSKVLDVPAGGYAEYSYHVPDGRLHEDAQHKLELKIASADEKEVYLDYMTKWTKLPASRWPGVRLGPQPELALSVDHYPSHRFIRLNLAPDFLDLPDCRAGRLTLTTSRGTTLVEKTLSWEGKTAGIDVPLPELLDDTYTAIVKFDGWDKALERKFIRKHYPWEGNNIGITDEVLPPFEPISVDGGKVNVVLRSYEVNGLGLWDSIKAAGNVSAGGLRELLAAPMVLRVNDGTAIAGKGTFTRTKPNEVIYQGAATHPGVCINTRTTTEYDGCMKVELQLLPGTRGEEIKALWLEIPLVDELMPLYHVSTTNLRFNPAGNTPSGDGRIWDTRDFPDGAWYGNFKPYIWLGAEERGLCWFADNDAGWVLDVDPSDPAKSAPSVEFIRENGVLTMKVNLVQKPFTITEPRNIVFGLMASPAKPMPQNWRTAPTSWMGSQYWGSDRSFAARYPRNHDLSPLDMMAAMRLGEQFDFNTFVEDWKKRNWAPGMPVIQKKMDAMLNLLTVSKNMASSSRGVPFTAYWEEFHTACHSHEEWDTFGKEWGPHRGSVKGIVSSYRDFAVWWGAEFVRRGIGLYFDNAFPAQAFDTVTTSAYRLPDGKIQPSAGMWARREYLKRIWVMHEQWSDPRMPALMMIHMTNTHIIPYMVWNHTNLDLEWFYGERPAQARYPHDLMRVQTIARQTGNIPHALARGGTNRQEIAAIHEFRLTDGLIHRPPKFLTDFGYGQDDCLVFNYWDENAPVTFSDSEVKWILLKRGNQARIVLATWRGTAQTVTMAIDSRKLGMTPAKALNTRAEDQHNLVGGKITFELEGYGTRIFDLK